jgi:hypothetical protein
MPDVIETLKTEVSSLAMRVENELKANPRVQEILAKFEEVKAALEAARADQPDEGEAAPPA